MNHFKKLVPFLDYIPGKLHTGKCWYISYYVKDPTNNEFVYKRMKLNWIKHVPTRRRYAQTLIQSINARLAEGWEKINENFSNRRNKLGSLS